MSLQIIRYMLLRPETEAYETLYSTYDSWQRTIVSDAITKMYLYTCVYASINLTYSAFLLCRSWINSSDYYLLPLIALRLMFQCWIAFKLYKVLLLFVEKEKKKKQRDVKRIIRKLFSIILPIMDYIRINRQSFKYRDLFVSRESILFISFTKRNSFGSKKKSWLRIERIREGKGKKVEESRDNNRLNRWVVVKWVDRKRKTAVRHRRKLGGLLTYCVF